METEMKIRSSMDRMRVLLNGFKDLIDELTKGADLDESLRNVYGDFEECFYGVLAEEAKYLISLKQLL